jgi:hypothetical protein
MVNQSSHTFPFLSFEHIGRAAGAIEVFVVWYTVRRHRHVAAPTLWSIVLVGADSALVQDEDEVVGNVGHVVEVLLGAVNAEETFGGATCGSERSLSAKELQEHHFKVPLTVHKTPFGGNLRLSLLDHLGD